MSGTVTFGRNWDGQFLWGLLVVPQGNTIGLSTLGVSCCSLPPPSIQGSFRSLSSQLLLFMAGVVKMSIENCFIIEEIVLGA